MVDQYLRANSCPCVFVFVFGVWFCVFAVLLVRVFSMLWDCPPDCVQVHNRSLLGLSYRDGRAL